MNNNILNEEDYINSHSNINELKSKEEKEKYYFCDTICALHRFMEKISSIRQDEITIIDNYDRLRTTQLLIYYLRKIYYNDGYDEFLSEIAKTGIATVREEKRSIHFSEDFWLNRIKQYKHTQFFYLRNNENNYQLYRLDEDNGIHFETSLTKEDYRKAMEDQIYLKYYNKMTHMYSSSKNKRRKSNIHYTSYYYGGHHKKEASTVEYVTDNIISTIVSIIIIIFIICILASAFGG